jgi:hypothetical protein
MARYCVLGRYLAALELFSFRNAPWEPPPGPGYGAADRPANSQKNMGLVLRGHGLVMVQRVRESLPVGDGRTLSRLLLRFAHVSDSRSVGVFFYNHHIAFTFGKPKCSRKPGYSEKELKDGFHHAVTS